MQWQCKMLHYLMTKRRSISCIYSGPFGVNWKITFKEGAQLNSGWYKVSDFFGLNGLSHSIVEQKSDVSGRYLGENGGDGAS